MNKLHVKKGDTVIVLAGNEKGKSGKVTKTFPKLGLVLVEGLNLRKKHQKPRREGQKGQIIDKQFPIHVSNVKSTAEKKEAKKKPVRAAKKK
jgi:large subunit ribosomal protein L24